jgi:hypothetical protein
MSTPVSAEIRLHRQSTPGSAAGWPIFLVAAADGIELYAPCDGPGG